MYVRTRTIGLALGTAALAVLVAFPLTGTTAVADEVTPQPVSVAADKATIKGKVLDANGSPVAKMPVELFEINLGQTSKGPQGLAVQRRNPKFGRPIARAVTDENGNFDLRKSFETNKKYRIQAGNRRVGLAAKSLQLKAGANEVELKLVKETGNGNR